MYVNLFPNKSLQAAKKSLVLTGVFLTVGGGYALLREFLWLNVFREEWALASAGLVSLGILMLAFGLDIFRLQDTFFSMTPERITYRVSVLGRMQEIYWKDVSALEISMSFVVFEFKSGKKRLMRLGAIQQPEIARHVARSLHLAALDKNLIINGVNPSAQKPALQA